MSENQELLQQLGQLLRWKKSKKFYAEKLGISEEEVSALLQELKDIGIEEVTHNVDGSVMVKFAEDVEKGTGEIVFNSDVEIRTLDELIEKCNIDTECRRLHRHRRCCRCRHCRRPRRRSHHRHHWCLASRLRRCRRVHRCRRCRPCPRSDRKSVV